MSLSSLSFLRFFSSHVSFLTPFLTFLFLTSASFLTPFLTSFRTHILSGIFEKEHFRFVVFRRKLARPSSADGAGRFPARVGISPSGIDLKFRRARERHAAEYAALREPAEKHVDVR